MAYGTLNAGAITPGSGATLTIAEAVTFSGAVTGKFKLARNEGLIVKYVSATTVDIDADFLTVFDSNNYAVILPTVNLTANITSSGVNGLDTGSEATNTWYHIYVIYNGTTVASLLSTSATSPTMPSGYTFKKYVGAVYNNSSSNFNDFEQRGNNVAIVGAQIGYTTNTSYQTKAGPAILPTTAVTCSGRLQANTNSSVDSGECFIASDSSGLGYQSIRYYDSGATSSRSIYGNFSSLVLVTPQTIFIKAEAGALHMAAIVVGYTHANIV